MNDENERHFLLAITVVFALMLAVVAIFCGGDVMRKFRIGTKIFIFAVVLIPFIVCVLLSIEVYFDCNIFFKPNFPRNLEYNGAKIIPVTEVKEYTRSVKDSELEKIVFTNKKQKISVGAFWGYSKLKYIELPSELEEIPDYAFAGCVALEAIIYPSVTGIGKYAFFDCTKLEKVDFGEAKITKISESAFEGCESLSEISLPDTIKTIEKSAFKNCKSLKNLIIPESVESIEDDAFSGCTKLVLEFKSSGREQVKKLLEKSGIKNDQKIKFNGTDITVKKFLEEPDNKEEPK